MNKKLHFRIIQTAEGRWDTQVLKNKKWVPVKWHYDAEAFATGDPVTHTNFKDAKHDLAWCCPLTQNLNRDDWDCKVIDLKGRDIKAESLGFNEEGKVNKELLQKVTPDHSTRELFLCDCSDIHHQFVVIIDQDSDWEMVVIEIMLNRNLHFWKRLWAGLKYIFANKPSRFGYFDKIILKKKDADRLQKVVDAVRKHGA